MGQDGEDAAVVVLGLGQVELHEEVAHVSLDRALAQIEASGDSCVRQASAISSSTSRSRSVSSASGSASPRAETRLATTMGSSADPP
jgi:hypothetical protein